MSTEYDLNICRGTDINIRLVVRDSNSNLINFSGRYVNGKVKYKYGNTGYLFDLGPYISAWSGVVAINIPASGTVTLPVGVFPYDIYTALSGDNSNATTILHGEVEVNPNITYPN